MLWDRGLDSTVGIRDAFSLEVISCNFLLSLYSVKKDKEEDKQASEGLKHDPLV